MRKILIPLLLLLCSVPVLAQMQGLRYGKLPNGLTYYVYGSKDFNGEVNFYLLQNVGAIVESDEQHGLAHFLEHMAFDATKHYPDGVLKFLRDNSIGTYNANTGLDETRYYLYNLPVSDTKIINHAFTIMRDWCDGISITPKDVEKERGIIIEEWRQRNDVNKRLGDHVAKVIYPGSKYAHHNVIGSVDILRTFKAKDLQQFYRTWYRPDLQCVIIVGDIDPEAYEQRVRDEFGSIKMPDNAPARIDQLIADNENPLYTQFTDAENTSDSFGLYQRIHTPSDPSKRSVVAEHLYTMVFNHLIGQRIGMLRNAGEEEFVAHTVTYAPLIRHFSQNAWDMVPYKGREIEALDQMLNLRETIRREGFTEQEFRPVQEEIYADLSKLLKSDNLGTPDNFMEVFKQNYLYGMKITSLRDQLQENAETIIEMTVEDLNHWIRTWMDDRNLSFVTYSKKPEDMPISQEVFAAALTKAKTAPSMEFKRPEPIRNFIDFPIAEGRIVEVKDIKGFEAKEWILSNGGRLLYKHIPEMKGQVFFAGSAEGGNSLTTVEDLPSYKAMQDLILQSGVHKYSRNQLAMWMGDKEFTLDISITDYMDNIGGMSSVKDFEDMLAYTHLIISKHNFDPAVFRKYKQRQLYLLENHANTPLSLAQDSIQNLLFPITAENPRKDHAFFDKMKFEDLRRLFDLKFGNAAHFTFCIAGDITEDVARMLTTRYIASLKGIPGTTPRSFKVHDVSSPAREIAHEIVVDTEGDVGQVEISYANDITLTAREEKVLRIMEALIQYRMFEELREKEAATYGIGVQASYNKVPTPGVTLNLRFETERTKVDLLKEKTYAILQEVTDGTFSNEDFKRVVLPLAMDERTEQKMNESAKENPMIWIALLNVYMETGEVPATDAKDVPATMYEEIQPAEISALARKIISGAKKRDIVLKSVAPEDREWIH